MREMLYARAIRPGDVILASSPRYHGPDVRVTGVEYVTFGKPFSSREIVNFEVERMSGTPTRLSNVPLNKPYMVERAS